MSWSQLHDHLTQVGLQYRTNPKIPVAIFDFDDTLVSTGGGMAEYYPPNTRIVDLAKHTRSQGIKNIILTARPMESHAATKINAGMYGIPYDRIITNDKSEPTSFKGRIRRQLEEKHCIVLNVGDKAADLVGSRKHTATVKLPEERIFLPKKDSFV